MSEMSVLLNNGEQLVVRVLEPPLGDYAGRIEYWWRDIREPVVNGQLAETSLDRFVIGEIEGEYAGSMTYGVPRDTRDLGVLGFVWTHDRHRRKGIARVLLRQLLADFRGGGGVAMHLCTTNPNAFALYTSEGFRPCVGDGLRYLAPSHDPATFDQIYYADAGPARIRDGEWGDLGRAAMLFNRTDPGWLIKDYPRRVFRDQRYESHYLRTWLPANRGHGFVLVLENPLKRVVGIVSAIEIDSFFEQDTLTLDFWACPAYLPQLPELLQAAGARAQEARYPVVQAYIAACDAEKRLLLEGAGFRLEAQLRDRLRVGDERHDLLLYRLDGPGRPAPRHPNHSYYAAGPAYLSTGSSSSATTTSNAPDSMTSPG